MDSGNSGQGGAFEAVLGRALVDPEYRERLTTKNEETQVAALMEAGLSEADAKDILPQLDEAKKAVDGLAGHDIFGARPYAA